MDLGEIPIQIPKDEFRNYIKSGIIGTNHIIFQRAMLDLDNKNSFIVGAKLKGEIISFIIINMEIDNVRNEDWCIIRYFKSTSDIEIDKYILKSLLSKIKEMAYANKIYNVGFPRYLIDKGNVINEELKNVILKCNFGNFNEKLLVNGERISLFCKLK